METLTALWGLSFTETLLVLAAILILLDIFVQGEAPTLLAYVALSVALVLQWSWPPLIRVAVGLAAWLLLLAFHALVWRKVLERLANRVVAPDRYKSGAAALVGRAGIVVDIEGTLMLRLDGDLYAIAEQPELGLRDGVRVRVVGLVGGGLALERLGANPL